MELKIYMRVSVSVKKKKRDPLTKHYVTGLVIVPLLCKSDRAESIEN